jgi:hypothetical protein
MVCGRTCGLAAWTSELFSGGGAWEFSPVPPVPLSIAVEIRRLGGTATVDRLLSFKGPHLD